MWRAADQLRQFHLPRGIYDVLYRKFRQLYHQLSELSILFEQLVNISFYFFHLLAWP